MEKYRKFADPKTGKHPFLPITTKVPLVNRILGAILSPFRFLLILKYFLFIILINKIFQKNSFISIKIEALSARIMLFILGIIVELKENEKIKDFGHGIYLANYSSFVDVLIMKAFFGIKFCQVYNSSEGAKRELQYYNDVSLLGDYSFAFSLKNCSHKTKPSGEAIRAEKMKN